MTVSIWSALLMSGLLLLLPACDSGQTNQPPSAGFSLEPSNPQAGVTVQFTADSSSDPEGNIDEFVWHFRRQSLGYDERATGKTPTHAFPRKGEYEVELTVRDDIGSTAKATKTVPVRLRYSQVAIRDTVQVSRISDTTATDGGEGSQDDGENWLQDGDPHFYYQLSDSTGVLYKSDEFRDFLPGDDLPVVFEKIDFATSNLSTSYTLSFYDVDSASDNPDDLIRAIDFSFDKNIVCNVNAATCYPDVKALTAPSEAEPENANTIVYLHLDWEK